MRALSQARLAGSPRPIAPVARGPLGWRSVGPRLTRTSSVPGRRAAPDAGHAGGRGWEVESAAGGRFGALVPCVGMARASFTVRAIAAGFRVAERLAGQGVASTSPKTGADGVGKPLSAGVMPRPQGVSATRNPCCNGADADAVPYARPALRIGRRRPIRRWCRACRCGHDLTAPAAHCSQLQFRGASSLGEHRQRPLPTCAFGCA